ncbi:hypothetical protein MIR68_001163 [Amoeboaphelidium protococcarum]|nr:hypothetical protein MIR68_001163 [Amoeboaphelidium protococcarum]
MQAKPKFRSRKLDYKKTLPILTPEETGAIPDIDDEVYRAVPLVQTGVEKEEEEEHHLQAVISASMVTNQGGGGTGRGTASAAMYIPTPDASRLISQEEYKASYKSTYKMPSSLIRSSRTVEECILSKHGVPSHYCADDQDLDFIQEINGDDGDLDVEVLELVIGELEAVTNEQMRTQRSNQVYASLDDLSSFFILNGSVISERVRTRYASKIYEYWRQRRVQKQGAPVMPAILFEESPWPSITNPTHADEDYDPFVCFRKRTVKQSRKTRRTDAQSLQKLVKLRQDMKSARAIAEMVLRREKMKKDQIINDEQVFMSRLYIHGYTQLLGIHPDVIEEARQAHRKARLAQSSQQLQEAAPGEEQERKRQKVAKEYIIPKDPSSAMIEQGLQKYHQTSLQSAEYDLTNGIPYPARLSMRHPASRYINRDNTTDIPMSQNNSSQFGHIRSRVGRGGRLIYDRVMPARARQSCQQMMIENGDGAEVDKFAFDRVDESSDEESVQLSQPGEGDLSKLTPFGIDLSQLDIRNAIMKLRLRLLGGSLELETASKNNKDKLEAMVQD